MSMLFSRTAIIPVWFVVFGLVAVFGSSMTFASGVVLLLVGGVALTVMLVLWEKLLPTIAALTAPSRSLAVPSADVVPNSWPNSGFRNSRQRRTKSG